MDRFLASNAAADASRLLRDADIDLVTDLGTPLMFSISTRSRPCRFFYVITEILREPTAIRSGGGNAGRFGGICTPQADLGPRLRGCDQPCWATVSALRNLRACEGLACGATVCGRAGLGVAVSAYFGDPDQHQRDGELVSSIFAHGLYAGPFSGALSDDLALSSAELAHRMRPWRLCWPSSWDWPRRG